MLHYKKLELTLEENELKQLVEKEAKKSQSSTSSMMTSQTYDHGKAIIEYPPHPEPSSTFDALLNSAKMKISLELMSSGVEAQVRIYAPETKKKMIEFPPPQVEMFDIEYSDLE